MAELMEISFWFWTLVGPGKDVLDGRAGVHIGAAWRIRLNRLCAMAMQPFCHITLTACYILIESTRNVYWSRASVCVCVCVSVRDCKPTLLRTRRNISFYSLYAWYYVVLTNDYTWGMVEVGIGWSGWNGSQPDGRCVCLC